MKVAVTYLDGNVFQHFGKSEFFIIYDVDNNEILNKEVFQVTGSGHGSKAVFLKEKGVEVLICGGMGAHAKASMDEIGLKVYAGLSGNTDAVISDFLVGKLIMNDSAIHACCH